jgi:O-antigen biosynthesis protein WbqP
MYEHFGKRALDVVLAFSALVLLSPLLAGVAAAIAMRDGRPVIFAQRRAGREGRPFTIYKFRTYPVGTPEAPSVDARGFASTSLGLFLRRTNIDELPQLWNILRGDMSVVGPRPGLLSQETQLAIRRANGAAGLRPGLTGLAQLRDRGGASETLKAAHDGDYARRVTLAGDLAILLRTALFVAGWRPGA